MMLNPTETKIPDTVQVDKKKSLALVSFTPLKLVSQLMKLPFLAPLYAYYFINSLAVAFNMTASLQLMLQWLRGFLQDDAPGFPVLGALDMEYLHYNVPGVPILGSLDMHYRLYSRWKHLLRDLVLEPPPPRHAHMIYVIQDYPVCHPPWI